MKIRKLLLILLLLSSPIVLFAAETAGVNASVLLSWQLNTDVQGVFGFYEDASMSKKISSLRLTTVDKLSEGELIAEGSVYVCWKYRSKEGIKIIIETNGLVGETSSEIIPLNFSFAGQTSDSGNIVFSSGSSDSSTVNSRKIDIRTDNAIGFTPHRYSGNVYLYIISGGN